jgi:hypothetical protein
MKQLFLLMEQSQQSGNKAPLDPDDITDLTAFGDHSMGTYLHRGPGKRLEEVGDAEKVIVEWWWVQDWDASVIDELYVRMSMISSLLNVPDRPSEFCVLNCEGYFYDIEMPRLGVIYIMPLSNTPTSGSTSSTLPIMLRDFIDRSQSVSQGHRPLIGDRFAPPSLSAAVLLNFMLSAGSIMTCALIMSSSSQTQDPVSLYETLTSSALTTAGPMKTGTSRLSILMETRDAFTNTRITGRFHQAFDNYSLGVVLLEIGWWYSIQGFDDELRMLSFVQKKDKLVEYAQRLGAYMGEIYRDAVIHLEQSNTRKRLA